MSAFFLILTPARSLSLVPGERSMKELSVGSTSAHRTWHLTQWAEGATGQQILLAQNKSILKTDYSE
jgi:hypothetical protein